MGQDSGEKAEGPAAAGEEGGGSPLRAEEAERPRSAPGEDDPAALRLRAQAAESRLADVVAAYRKLKLDGEGFRDRVVRDVERRHERHRESLLMRFIEMLDNFDRALAAAEQSYAGNPLIDGLLLVRAQLLQILRKEGLERIPVLGLPFDPGISEAVGMQAVSDPDHEGVVVRELSRGYRLNGRIARASRVMIGRYGEEASRAREEPLIGADEVAGASETAEPDLAAATIRLTEDALREIFATPDDAEETEEPKKP